MELKPGYKQTEVGVIPEDWETKRLGELFDFTNGRPHEAHIEEGGRFSLITLDSIDINGSLKRAHKQTDTWDNSLRQGDLVAVLSDLAKGDLLGLCDLIPEDNLYVLNQRMGRLRARAPVNSYFARLQINSRQSHFKARSQGSAQRHVYRRDFDSLSIPYPSLPEQSSIANTLLHIDALRTSLEEMISKKRLIKQAAMQELLTGKRRLPGFEGEWEEIVLGEHAKFFKGKGLPKSDLTPSGEYGCVHYGELFTLYNESIRETRSYTHKVDNLFVSAANDVLMPTSDVTPRGLAKASCIDRDGIVIGGDILVIRPTQGAINGIFLSYLIRGDSNQILRLVTGTTVYHIYSSDMKRFVFYMPSVIEQEAIVEFLDDLEVELEALEARLEKTQAIKKGMMQQLLTGKIRLR